MKKTLKKSLALLLSALMVISMIPVFAITASAKPANVVNAAPTKYGLVRTGNGSRGSGDNGCIVNDGGSDNMSAMLWEFDISAIHDGYDITSATLTEDIWSINNRNIPNQYLDFWYCNPADINNYSNYLNNGNYRDSSLGYGTTGPSTYKAAFGITASQPLYSSQHVYENDSATLSFSNQALIDALNKAADENWDAIVFVAMYNEPAATTWSDIWAGLPKLSFATTAKPSEDYAKANMASYNGSNMNSTSAGIRFANGGDAYTTNVLYSANANIDSDYNTITLDGSNKLGFNVYPASSRVVYLNDSDSITVGYPLIARVQRETGGLTSVHWGVNYIAIDTANNWSLTDDWHVSSSDRTWDDILSSQGDQSYGIYKINYDEALTSNYNADITAQSWGNHASGSHYVDTSYITYRNAIYYDSSAINFGNSYYYSIPDVPTFKASGDGCGHWTGGQGSWNNREGSGFTINGKTSIDLRVLDIKPLKDIVSSADFKSNFTSISANENIYTAESLASYYDVIARILRFNVNYLDVSDDTALASSAAEIKGLVDDYNTYKTPVKKTYKATFKAADGSTIEERDVYVGDALGALPANTVGATHIANTNTHSVYTWEGVTTAETVITENTEFTETTGSFDCTFEDVHTPATDALNGYTDKVCSACGNVDEAQRVYDAQNFTAYDTAVADYEDVIAAADYTAKYTAASREAYEAAVDAAEIDKTDVTLSPKAIADAAAAISAAKSNLGIATYTVTYEKADATNSTEDFAYGTEAATVAAAAPALPANYFDDEKHYSYAWDTAFADVTGAVTYTQVETAEEHSYTSAYTAATAETNGFTTYTCDCGRSYVTYDAQDFTTYDAAVEEAEALKVNEAYTAESRTAYAQAVEAAKINKNDASLSPTAIETATAAIEAAKSLLEAVPDEPEDTYNLTITDDIDINFNIDTEYQDAEEGYITVEYVEINKNEISTETKTETIDATGAQTSISMTAIPAQIAEPYKITVYNKDGDVIREFEQSVVDYCNAVINSNDPAITDKDKEVAKGILDYGAAANAYFGYANISETDNYAVSHSADYNDYVAALDTDDIKSKAHASFSTGADASGENIYVTGVSYLALIEPEFRFYVSQTNEVWAAKTDVTITDLSGNAIDGVEAKMVKTSNGNCVRVTGLKACDFGKSFKIMIGDAKLEYNGYAFLYTALTSTTIGESMLNLAKGVYRYAAACEAKFA